MMLYNSLKKLVLVLSLSSVPFLSANPVAAINAALSACKVEMVKVIALSSELKQGSSATAANMVSHTLIFTSNEEPGRVIRLMVIDDLQPGKVECVVQGIKLSEDAEEESLRDELTDTLEESFERFQKNYTVSENQFKAEKKRLSEKVDEQANRAKKNLKKAGKDIESGAKAIGNGFKKAFGG